MTALKTTCPTCRASMCQTGCHDGYCHGPKRAPLARVFTWTAAVASVAFICFAAWVIVAHKKPAEVPYWAVPGEEAR